MVLTNRKQFSRCQQPWRCPDVGVRLRLRLDGPPQKHDTALVRLAKLYSTGRWSA
jgi:hypothetical protein